MRIATIHGRVALIDGTGSGAVDVERAGGGRFGPEPAGVYEGWTEFVTWAGSALSPPSEGRYVAGLSVGQDVSERRLQMAATPPRWLAPGDVQTSYIEGIGEMRHRIVASGLRGRDANSDPEEER